jgi:hypothetical protein
MICLFLKLIDIRRALITQDFKIRDEHICQFSAFCRILWEKKTKLAKYESEGA